MITALGCQYCKHEYVMWDTDPDSYMPDPAAFCDIDNKYISLADDILDYREPCKDFDLKEEYKELLKMPVR